MRRSDIPPGKTREELYAIDSAKPGRPLKFTLTEALSIGKAYWQGRKTIRALARERQCSELTISRLIHGETYGYAYCGPA